VPEAEVAGVSVLALTSGVPAALPFGRVCVVAAPDEDEVELPARASLAPLTSGVPAVLPFGRVVGALPVRLGLDGVMTPEALPLRVPPFGGSAPGMVPLSGAPGVAPAVPLRSTEPKLLPFGRTMPAEPDTDDEELPRLPTPELAVPLVPPVPLTLPKLLAPVEAAPEADELAPLTELLVPVPAALPLDALPPPAIAPVA
jgi:hypothetical protein